MKPHLPRAVLLDLDDTILTDSGDVERCWREACFAFGSQLGPIDPAALHQQIERTREAFWADPERHRAGRLDLDAAARTVAAGALAEVGVVNATLAGRIAEKYRSERTAGVQPCPGAIETLAWLREGGCRLALLTNGSGPTQRTKLSRFGLADFFDSILIEGELGFGKPDARIYARALTELAVTADTAWMVGDHLEWDVAQPQRMGLLGLWIDVRGVGLPDASPVQPTRILRALSDLRA